MSNSPLVSVIMAAYNRERFIRESVESVLNQTFGDYELVVVDDASTDRTRDILQEFRGRVEVVQRDTNSGLPGKARNDAMRRAKGKYFALLDSDDLWYPDKLEKQVAYMESHPEVGLSHTFCRVIDEKGRELRVRREDDMPRSENAARLLIRESFITTSTVVMRSGVFDRLGGFSERSELRCGEDREFFLRTAREFAIGFLPEVLSAYRRSSENIMGDDWELQQHVLNTQRWILSHPDLWGDEIGSRDVVAALVDKSVEYAFFWQARGQHARSLSVLLKAIPSAPVSTVLWGRLVRTAGRAVLPSDRRRQKS